MAFRSTKITFNIFTNIFKTLTVMSKIEKIKQEQYFRSIMR